MQLYQKRNCESTRVIPKITQQGLWPSLNLVLLIQSLVHSGLLLSVSCQPNSLAEKVVIAGWILARNHSVKNKKQFLGNTHTIIRYLNHIELSKWNFWNKFLTTLSIGATITSKVIETKSCFKNSNSSLALGQVALEFCLPWASLSLLFNKQLVDSLLISCPLGNREWKFTWLAGKSSCPGQHFYRVLVLPTPSCKCEAW